MTERPAPPQVLAATPAGRALLFEYAENQGLPPHTHAGQTVIVAVLSGTLQLNVDDQTLTLQAGEVQTVSSEGHFSSRALSSGTRVLVTLLNNA